MQLPAWFGSCWFSDGHTQQTPWVRSELTANPLESGRGSPHMPCLHYAAEMSSRPECSAPLLESAPPLQPTRPNIRPGIDEVQRGQRRLCARVGQLSRLPSTYSTPASRPSTGPEAPRVPAIGDTPQSVVGRQPKPDTHGGPFDPSRSFYQKTAMIAYRKVLGVPPPSAVTDSASACKPASRFWTPGQVEYTPPSRACQPPDDFSGGSNVGVTRNRVFVPPPCD